MADQPGGPDHVEELIEAFTRSLSIDDSGEQFVTFERGDGRRLVRLPTFHELLAPYLEKVAPLQARGQPLGAELEAEGQQIRQQRAERIAAELERRRADIAAFVEGD